MMKQTSIRNKIRYVLIPAVFMIGIFQGAGRDIAKADTVPLSPHRGIGLAYGWVLEASDVITLDREIEIASMIEEYSVVYPSSRLPLRDSAGEALGIHVEPGTPMSVLEDSGGMLRVMFRKDGSVVTGYVDRKVYVAWECTPDSFLGILSEKYESTGDPGKISSGKGDHGGKSYGAWQLSSRAGSLKEFISSLKETQPEFHARLVYARDRDGGYHTRFDREWKAIASEHYDEFYKLQWEFTKAGYYEKAVRHAKSKGADIDALMEHVAFRNAVWSAAVQLGWGISGNYIARLSGMTDPVEAIDRLYETRIRNIGANFRSSPTLHNSLRNRFRNEWRDALEIQKLSTLHAAAKMP